MREDAAARGGGMAPAPRAGPPGAAWCLALGLLARTLPHGPRGGALAASPRAPPRRAALQRRRCAPDGAPEAAAPVSRGLPLPVGPLCFFQSDYWQEPLALDGVMGKMKSAERMTPIMMKMKSGERLEREEEEALIREMSDASDRFKAINFRLRFSEDFQAIELFMFMEAWLEQAGLSLDAMEAMAAWQPGSMQAMFEKRVPPPPPAGLDMAAVQEAGRKMQFCLGAMAIPGNVRPFSMSTAALRSDLVREEYEALMRDHEYLIKYGKTYRTFDPRGKEIFLDQMAAVTERWELLLGRFRLMGELDPDYIAVTSEYLAQFGCSTDEFLQHVRNAHSLMRKQAEQEGLQH